MDIQWFPGHMAKARKLIKENIKLADVIVEVADARIPGSSLNPDMKKLIGEKKRLIVLNKCDLADPSINNKWIRYYDQQGEKVFLTDSITGHGIDGVLKYAKDMMVSKEKAEKEKGRVHRPTRIMVVGIPNTGKSTFINSIAKKKIALTADRPGVTKDRQWIRLNKDFSMLDMPGVLWPKFENETTGHNLAFIGTIRDEIIDIQQLALELIKTLKALDAKLIEKRYVIEINPEDTALCIYEKIAAARGFLLKGGIMDYERTAKILLDEFRGGLLGKISLEVPDERK